MNGDNLLEMRLNAHDDRLRDHGERISGLETAERKASATLTSLEAKLDRIQTSISRGMTTVIVALMGILGTLVFYVARHSAP